MSDEKNREMKESVQVQKNLWIKEQMQKKREQEDALIEQIEQEQRVLQGIDDDIQENLAHSKDGRKYRDEVQKRVETYVYEMHELSEDKLEGMREYKNAFHRGFSLAMFALSLSLTGYALYLYHSLAQITLMMLALTATQAVLLVHHDRGIRVLRLFCKILNVLLFPLILIFFLSYMNEQMVFNWILLYGTYVILVILGLSTVAYFLYNPYQEAKDRVEDAKSTLRNLEKQVKIQVKKNQKNRIKLLEREEKKQAKEEKKQLRKEEASARIKQLFHKKNEEINAVEQPISSTEQASEEQANENSGMERKSEE